MAEKQKESKILSMLEKRGMIRKVDDDSADKSSDSPAGYNPDIKPIFDSPDDVVTVKTAPRQPVPGLSTPVFPSERSTEAPPAKAVETPALTPTPAPAAPPPQPVYTEPPASATAHAPTLYQEQQKPSSAPFGGLGLFRNADGTTNTGVAESVSRESEARPENYTERYLNINELYDALALRSKKTDTIYLIEEYLQTLPGSLPDSQRREIVSKILESSGFDFDLLMGDGVLRVKMLKEYAERFARHTDDYIAARQAEIEELDQKMQHARKLIANRKELHKKQFYTIEAEAQRLKEILTFISG